MHVEINDYKKWFFLRKCRIVQMESSGVIDGVWFEGSVDGSCCFRSFIYLIWGCCEIP